MIYEFKLYNIFSIWYYIVLTVRSSELIYNIN